MAQSEVTTLSSLDTKNGDGALEMHKDRLSASQLNLKDPYVSSSLGLYAIHNVLRRNLAACADHAAALNESNVTAFVRYAGYTLYVLKDQLESVDTTWFPKFGTYDKRFNDQISAHAPLVAAAAKLEELLKADDILDNLVLVCQRFRELGDKVDQEYDRDEYLCNQLGHRVPLDEIQDLEKGQEERRRSQVKTYGHLWTAVYLLRGLAPEERAIFPPGIPKLVMGGMLTAGALQFRKDLQFSPKFS